MIVKARLPGVKEREGSAQHLTILCKSSAIKHVTLTSAEAWSCLLLFLAFVMRVLVSYHIACLPVQVSIWVCGYKHRPFPPSHSFEGFPSKQWALWWAARAWESEMLVSLFCRFLSAMCRDHANPRVVHSDEFWGVWQFCLASTLQSREWRMFTVRCLKNISHIRTDKSCQQRNGQCKLHFAPTDPQHR